MILLLCAVVGLVYGPIAPIYNYVMQTQSPPHLRGRVVGVMGSLAYAAGPLGLILAGPLADAVGPADDVLARWPCRCSSSGWCRFGCRRCMNWTGRRLARP